MLAGRGPWLDRVFKNRMRALSQRPGQRSERSQLPALVVYTLDESAEIFNVAPREYKCKVQLVIEIVADAGEDNLDSLDDMAAVVERIMGRDDTIADTADDCVYTGSRTTIVSEGVERPIGGVAVMFEATYYRAAPDEDSNSELDDLLRVHVDYSLNNAQSDERDRAQTHIEDLDQ